MSLQLLTGSVWAWALAATAIISAAPIPILMFIPINDKTSSHSLLKVLLSFAVGGLLGDVFLHLLPHASPSHNHGNNDSHHDHDHGHGHDHHHGHSHGHDHSHSHSHGSEDEGHDHTAEMYIGLWVIAGIVAFLIVEKFVRYTHGQTVGEGGHSHSHSHSHSHAPSKDESKVVDQKDNSGLHQRKNTEGKNQSKDTDKNGKDKEKKPKAKITAAGYLNLVADFTHNFTDGLAIGASFLVSKKVGVVTTIAILFHEIPHEIGDFAILVQSGFSKPDAMKAQLTTAIGAMLGTVVGLLAEGIGHSANWILPFTAGGFIYIATVTVIPTLLEDTGLKQSIAELFALAVGVGMMVLVGLFE